MPLVRLHATQVGDQALRLYGGENSTFAKNFYCMHEAIGEDKTLKVSYGSVKVAPRGKGEVRVPTSRAYKECAYRFLTLYTDEC